MTMDEETVKRLASLKDSTKLTEAEERMRSGWYAPGPYFCLNAACGKRILKPRFIKYQDGKKQVTLCWCSQECHDAWIGQFHLPGPHWEKYNQEGVLIGYVIPKRGFVPIEDVDRDRGQEGGT